MKPSGFAIERVTWRDSASHGGDEWQSLDDIRETIAKHGALVCESVGFVVSEGNGTLTLATSYSCDEEGAPSRVQGALTIPLFAIETRLRIGKLRATTRRASVAVCSGGADK